MGDATSENQTSKIKRLTHLRQLGGASPTLCAKDLAGPIVEYTIVRDKLAHTRLKKLEVL